jgi:hypothetical protein
LAEAGIAQALNNMPAGASGYLIDPNYTYNAVVVHTGVTASANYYTITSTGTVVYPTGNVTRTLIGVVKTGVTNPLKFQYGIETTTDLVIKGSVDINPSNSWKEHSTLDFADMFGVSKATMKANATHLYTSGTFSGSPVDGVTWVDVGAGTLNISGNLVGSGILVINGDVKFSGTIQFSGIVYVIGTLTMTGTVDTFGSVLAESSTTVDTVLKGNVGINYDTTQIALALQAIQFFTKQLVSWQES